VDYFSSLVAQGRVNLAWGPQVATTPLIVRFFLYSLTMFIRRRLSAAFLLMAFGGHMARYGLVLLMMVLAPVTRTTAQDTTARLFHNFTVVPNITYLTASNYESKLDLYVTRTPEQPLPTLIYIHDDD
jgi:hypothetical protein